MGSVDSPPLYRYQYHVGINEVVIRQAWSWSYCDLITRTATVKPARCNFMFEFLRPTIDEIVAEYKKVHGNQPPPQDSEDEDEQDAVVADDEASDGNGDA